MVKAPDCKVRALSSILVGVFFGRRKGFINYTVLKKGQGELVAKVLSRTQKWSSGKGSGLQSMVLRSPTITFKSVGTNAPNTH